MIEFYYTNKLSSKSNTHMTSSNLYELLVAIYKPNTENKKIESLLLLNNIFTTYDLHPDNTLLSNIASFKAQYF